MTLHVPVPANGMMGGLLFKMAAVLQRQYDGTSTAVLTI